MGYKLLGFVNSMAVQAQKSKWVQKQSSDVLILSFPLAVRKTCSNNTGSKKSFFQKIKLCIFKY